MADNTELNPGTGGDVYASDDIAGIKFQRIKAVFGADGVNEGDVSSANPFPVKIAGLDIPTHDYLSLSYTGSDLTGVVYKTGGAGGTVVATLTLGYSGGNLISVTRT